MKFGLFIHVQSVLVTLLAVLLAMIGGRLMFDLKYGDAQPLVQWVPKTQKPKKIEPVKKTDLVSTETVMDPYYG